jgi:Tol biopolymer transport system component
MIPLLILLLTGSILVSACGGDGGSEFTGPDTGALQLTTTTSGTPADPDGYRVSIDGGEAVPIGTNATLVVDTITPGDHSILLSEVSPECTAAGENPRTLSVVAGSTTETTFSVSCSPLTGRLQITSATLGSAPDADGYLVQIGAALERTLGANEAVALDVAPGEQTLLLTGLAPGCAVTGENPRVLTVTRNSLTQTTFIVSCPGSAAGQLAFTTDRDGNDEIYLVNADGTGLQRLTSLPGADIQPTWSPDGSRLAFASDRSGNFDIFVMDASGTGIFNLTKSPGDDFLPAWSPDGSKIAYVRDEGGFQTFWEIFVMDANGGNQVNLTNNPDFAAAPEWSPDGKKIAFESDRDFETNPEEFTFEIFVMQADGSGVVNITNHDANDEFPSWSPDGSRIAFQTDRAGGVEIFLMDPSGENLVNLTNHPAADFGAAWSPDGDRIAFSSSRYGGQRREDLLVMAPDGTGLIRLTPGDGSARFAAWRP